MPKTFTAILCLLLLAAPAVAEPEGPLIESDPLGPSALPGAMEPAPQAEPALTFWCSPYPRETGWAVQVTREWNALHPEAPVRLQALPADRLAEDVFREAIERGDTPDLTNHLFPVNVHEFAARGALLPLDDLPELMDHLRARSGEGADRPFRSADGHLYQFPWKNNPILFQYNAALFRRYGLTPARTYSEFLEGARRLPRGTHLMYVSPAPEKFWKRYYDFFPLYVAASGGRGLLTPEGRADFDNPAGVAVMSFLRDLYAAGASPTRPLYDEAEDQTRAFVENRLATMLTGPWSIEQVRDAGGEEVFFDFAPLPVPDRYPLDRPVFTYGNFRNFGIFSSCRRVDLAVEFIRFATDRERDLVLFQATSQLPYRRDLQEDPEFAAALQRAPAPLAKFTLQSRWVQPVDNVPWFNEVLQILTDELVACALEGTRTPEEAIREAARRTDALAVRRQASSTP